MPAVGGSEISCSFPMFGDHRGVLVGCPLRLDGALHLGRVAGLVEGHGLVFNHGERVHTFTSPLGVLLPALCHLLTFRGSDAAALWLFHVFGALAFAGAASLMHRTASSLRFPPAIAGLLVLWLVTDAKSVDFSINGMETGFLLLFTSHLLWALFACGSRQALQIGLACGGLMWMRPDGVIYIVALGLGVLLFAPGEKSRREWLRTLGIAAAVCTLVYLPWFAWAWSYYGTPVPHNLVESAADLERAGSAALGSAAWQRARQAGSASSASTQSASIMPAAA